MENLIIRSINELNQKYSFREEGVCKVDGVPCRCLYFGTWISSLGGFCYITLIWWRGAWRTPCTAFGMGYHGKMISVPSTI